MPPLDDPHWAELEFGADTVPHEPVAQKWSVEIDGDLLTWMSGLALARRHDDVADQLRYVSGTATCPECGSTHALFPALD